MISFALANFKTALGYKNTDMSPGRGLNQKPRISRFAPPQQTMDEDKRREEVEDVGHSMEQISMKEVKVRFDVRLNWKTR